VRDVHWKRMIYIFEPHPDKSDLSGLGREEGVEVDRKPRKCFERE
jgi:hypothetical protein